MKIAIGADASGFVVKEAIKEMLIAEGYDVTDVGTLKEEEPVLYTDTACNVAKLVQSGEAEKGVLCCGTGMGVSIMANKFKGVYAGLVECPYTAEKCAAINKCNVLCLGGFLNGNRKACDMVKIWLNTKFATAGFEAAKEELEGQLENMKRIEDINFK